MKTDGTVKVMRTMAERMRDTAAKLDRLSNDLEKNGDWGACSDALNTVANLIPNLRIDLLAARPIREHQYRIFALERSGGSDG